ncbi:MAG TPA: DUF2225 domain-containing protein [Planctomycetota bacterium]|nr:DUF2225 domain-containing protein [Planctomycetota bacterium]
MSALVPLIALLLATSDIQKQVKVTCPVDGAKFEATEINGTNHWGGRDTDGCVHAFNTTPLESWVWVCPVCKFAGRKKDFEGTIPDAEKKALLDGLKPLVEIKKDAKQNQIPGYVKYDLVAQVAGIRKAPVEEAGRAWLSASWSCRQQAAVYLADFDEWEALRDRYNLNQKPIAFGLTKNRTDFELDAVRKLEKDLDGKLYEKAPNRILARYLAEYLWRKHGENAAAERWLGELGKLKGENSIVDDAVAKSTSLLALERDFQKKALEAYRSAYEGGTIDRKVAPEVAYLLGELSRRLGEPKSALAWYQKCLDGTDSDALKKLAAAQRALAEKP